MGNEVSTTAANLVMPAGYDPQAPDAGRHRRIEMIRAEARAIAPVVGRFAVLMAAVKDEGMYSEWGFKTYADFMLEEYGLSRSSAYRIADQGRAMIAAGPQSSITAGASVLARGTDGARSGIARPATKPAISQRSAARSKAGTAIPEPSEAEKIAKASAEAARKRQAAPKPKPERMEPAEPATLEPEPPATPGAEPPGRTPQGPRREGLTARQRVDAILEAIDGTSPTKLAVVMRPGEKQQVCEFFAGFASQWEFKSPTRVTTKSHDPSCKCYSCAPTKAAK